MINRVVRAESSYTYLQLNSGVALITSILSQCCFPVHISNSIVDNDNTFCHSLDIGCMLKSLNAVKYRLYCNNLMSQLSCQQCVVADVSTNVKHLSISTSFLIPQWNSLDHIKQFVSRNYALNMTAIICVL